MRLFLQLIITGLVAGAVYSVYACGLTLLVSATGIFDFAYGATAFMCGLFFFELTSALGWPRLLTFAIAVFLFAPLLALALERMAFRRLTRAPEIQRIVATIGLTLAIPGLAYLLVDVGINDLHWKLASIDQSFGFPGIGPEPPRTYGFLVTKINTDQIIALAATVVSVAILWALLSRTRLGLQTRAVVDRNDLASLRGIDTRRISRTSWIMGTMLASVAGVIGAPIFGLSPSASLEFVVASAAIVVVARFRSLPIAMAGGLLLGAFVSLAAGYGTKVPLLKTAFADIPGLQSSIIYLLLFAALLGRGWARRGRQAGVAVAEFTPRDYLHDLSRIRRWWPWVAVAGIFLVWDTGLFGSGFHAGGVQQSLLVNAACMTLIFLSFTLVVGLGGVASLAQATFVSCAGLVAGFLASESGFLSNFFVSCLFGALAAAVLGCVVAIPALRLGGLALALATLALALIGDNVLFQIPGFTNHNQGWTVSLPKWGPINLNDQSTYAVFIFAVVLIAMWLVVNIRKSPTGRAISAVRFSPPGAASVGVQSRPAIVTLFGLSAFLAGLGGVLLAYGAGTVIATTYPAYTGLQWLAIAVVWGIRRPGSALLAGLTGAYLPWILQQIPGLRSPYVPLLLAGTLCIALAQNPDGILAASERTNYLRRERRRRLSLTEPDAAAPPQAPVPVVEDQSPARAGVGRSPILAEPAVAGDQEIVLTVKDLRAGYLDTEVLHGVNITLWRGTISAIIGPNGAGKSTLCGAIGGTVECSSGIVTLNGGDISDSTAHERFRQGVMLAPESRGIFPSMTVDENLALVLAEPGQRDAVYDRYPALRARRRVSAGLLSGGEQQMLCLAPLTALQPALVIADEPCLGLAPLVAKEIWRFFVELSELGVSVLLVEERARNVLNIASYTYVLSLGQVQVAGPTASIGEKVLETYLGQEDLRPATPGHAAGRVEKAEQSRA